MDSLEYRDAISDQAARLRSVMTAEMKRLINHANFDLYNGPLYLDSEGDACSCFDEGAMPFNFSGACDKIREWLDSNVDDLQQETYFDDESGESTYERIDGSSGDICKALVGAELYQHVY